MGLIRIAGQGFELEDRILRHLQPALEQLLITDGRTFFLKINMDHVEHSVLISPSHPLHISRAEDDVEVNEVWMRAIYRSLESGAVRIVSEKDAEAILAGLEEESG